MYFGMAILRGAERSTDNIAPFGIELRSQEVTCLKVVMAV
jgi:hypothetical protein